MMACKKKLDGHPKKRQPFANQIGDVQVITAGRRCKCIPKGGKTGKGEASVEV